MAGLGVKGIPAWITGKGKGNGGLTVTTNNGGVQITMTNAVKFIGGVRGLQGKCQAALQAQEQAMRREINALLDKRR